MELQERIARDLLSIGAVFLRPEQPFTWASGIKSPVYCDNRLTLTAPEVRLDVEIGLAETIPQPLPGLRSADGHFHRRHRPRRHHRPYPRPAHGLCALRGQGSWPRQPDRGQIGKGPEGRGRRGPHLHRRQRHRSGQRAARSRRAGAGHRQHLHLRHEEGPWTASPPRTSRTSAFPTSTPSAAWPRGRAISRKKTSPACWPSAITPRTRAGSEARNEKPHQYPRTLGGGDRRPHRHGGGHHRRPARNTPRPATARSWRRCFSSPPRARASALRRPCTNWAGRCWAFPRRPRPRRPRARAFPTR